MTTRQSPADQTREAWDAVAAGYDRHVSDRTMAFGERVLSRLELGPQVRLVDVAAGSGALAIPAARTGAHVVAVDVSPVMIEGLAARGRAEGLNTLDPRVGTGEALPFDDDSLDVAVSLNGVSVFPDISAGLSEMVRVTRPGGEVLVAAFGPLETAEFVAFPLSALRAVAGERLPTPPDPLPPFRLTDPATLERTLANTGLTDVRIEAATWELVCESADHLMDMILSSNPIVVRMTAALTDDDLAQVREVLDGMLRERSGGGPGATLHNDMRIGHGRV